MTNIGLVTSMHHVRWWEIHHEFNNLWRQLRERRWCICGEVPLIFPQTSINLHFTTSFGRQCWRRSVFSSVLHNGPSRSSYYIYIWRPPLRYVHNPILQLTVVARGPLNHYISVLCTALMKSVLWNELYYCSCLWTNTKTKYYISFVYTIRLMFIALKLLTV